MSQSKLISLPKKAIVVALVEWLLSPVFVSNDILQIAIPEMLSQTGITGRQFAHLLIRAHQESLQNHFPDLERAAEEVGLKRLNLSVTDLLDIAKGLGLDVRWVKRTPHDVTDELGVSAKQLVTSFLSRQAAFT